MRDVLAFSALFASGENFDRFRQMGAELRARTTEGSGDDLVLLVIVALVVPLFVVALWFLVRMQEKSENLTSPKALFRELCKAHGLDRSQRALLLQLAIKHALTDPGRLFLEPERFDTTLLGPRWREHAEQLDTLRARLFSRQREQASTMPSTTNTPAGPVRTAQQTLEPSTSPRSIEKSPSAAASLGRSPTPGRAGFPPLTGLTTDAAPSAPLTS